MRSDDSPRSGLGELLRISAPAGIGNIGMILMSLVDNAMVGRLGATQLAATNIVSVFTGLVVVFVLGLVGAGGTLVSQAQGAGKPEVAGRTLAQLIQLAVVFGGGLCVCLFFAEPLVHLATPDPAVAVEAYRYMVWRLPGLGAFFVTAAYKAYLDALGRTRPGMVLALVANLVNLPANELFIFGSLGPLTLPFEPLGIAGAGAATTVSRTFMLVGFMWLVHRPEHRDFGVGRARWFRPDPELRRTILRVGVPAGLQHFVEVAAFGAFGLLMGWVGTVDQAGHTIAMGLTSLPFVFAMGLGVGASVIVGRGVGAGRLDDAMWGGYQAIVSGIVTITPVMILFLVAPEPLARIFTNDPEVITAAIFLIRLGGLYLVVDAVQAICVGALRGAGDTLWPMYAGIALYWAVGIPLAWLLGIQHGHGGAGIWGTLIGLLTAMALVMVARFRFGPWREAGALVD